MSDFPVAEKPTEDGPNDSMAKTVKKMMGHKGRRESGPDVAHTAQPSQTETDMRERVNQESKPDPTQRQIQVAVQKWGQCRHTPRRPMIHPADDAIG